MGQTATPTIAIIETLDHLRSTNVRVAYALARPRSTNVLLCHWHGLELSNFGVTMKGRVHRVENGSITPHIITDAVPVDILFFDGAESGELTESDMPVLERLAAAGVDVLEIPRYRAIDRMMLEASRRGVVTNALGSSRSWGPKHHQELKLRRYESATGQIISRPKTYVARPHEVRAVLHIFAEHGEVCLVKPAFGAGGRGIHIVRPGESVPQFEDTVVVQPLIPDPLLVEGHKADIRFCLLIDVGDVRASRRLSPVFLRRAAMPYVPNDLTAEITNNAYRLRHGFPPDVRPLSNVTGISHDLQTEIINQLDSLAQLLIGAYFWNAGQDSTEQVANRVLLFGIDVLVASLATTPRLYFLETNPYPAYFPNLPDCDHEVEEMLSREYLPVMLQALRWRSDE